jgi:S-adenosylmethionine synthetase
MIERVVKPVLPSDMVDSKTDYLVNPTGAFSVGGPQADTGLTGRKIIVDTYGGMAKHGGGCFSGKDPTKVDRSAAYMMRYVAKNVVAAGLAKKCEIQIAYAIGKADPMGIMVDTWRTNAIPEEKIGELVLKYFDLTPRGIMDKLDLRRPIYRQVAAYGHFGRTDLEVPWEDTDMAEVLRREAGI